MGEGGGQTCGQVQRGHFWLFNHLVVANAKIVFTRMLSRREWYAARVRSGLLFAAESRAGDLEWLALLLWNPECLHTLDLGFHVFLADTVFWVSSKSTLHFRVDSIRNRLLKHDFLFIPDVGQVSPNWNASDLASESNKAPLVKGECFFAGS